MYQHGKKINKPKNPKVMLHAAVIMSIALIAVAYILHRDLNRSTSEKTTVPIVTEIGEDKKDTILINEPLFSLELPSGWKQVNRMQSNVANYYEWRSTKRGEDDRLLRLHVDIMPQSYKMVRIQPLRVNGGKFSLGNLSDICINFAYEAGSQQRPQGNAPVNAKWENITFVCDPITNNQTIGTGTVEGGIAAKVAGASGNHSYFFYFEDHNIRQDDKILINALKSFVAH